MNQLSGYKIGNKVEVRTHVVYAGEPFETWESGIVIGEGHTHINAHSDDWQSNIIVRTATGLHIRASSQLR